MKARSLCVLATMLAMVVQHGGTQHYGCNMMPSESARTKVSDAEAMALSEWILNMKK